jgi:hypothetical protein
MREHCKQGETLVVQFEYALRVKGLLDAELQAAQIVPVGLARLQDIAQAAREAEKRLVQARHSYVEHMTECLVCSRALVGFPEDGMAESLSSLFRSSSTAYQRLRITMSIRVESEPD